MADFKIKTKNQVEIEKKPRVYFTCHPEDFEKSFDKICNDIFLCHACAIYYAEDLTERIEKEEREIELGRSNLLVVPVTYKLLSTKNRAMDEDVPYAIKEHIPILPIMMESGIESLYSMADKFGEMQYLNPYGYDKTEIPYEEKLRKYLESVLISSELAEAIRAAFDAYIFLSYRKKDRKYANELMKLIHKNPECRDIAIWFDEFLTPGENFNESIERILKDSKLFTLLVTPNLLEKPNFVLDKEYPAAKEAEISILPVQMTATDKKTLDECFTDLPPCIDACEDKLFRERLLDAITGLAVRENDSPEHNFLIGLAYFDGIDVEVNRELGIKLITSAAEEGLLAAMQRLALLYEDRDYHEAIKWAERIVDYYIKQNGEEYGDTLTALGNLALLYDKAGKSKKAQEVHEKVYEIRCRTLGEEHCDTVTTLNNMAVSYDKSRNSKKAQKLYEKVYKLQCKIHGEEHPNTLAALHNLALSYGNTGDYRTVLEYMKKVYSLECKILGEENSETLITLNNIAGTYANLGNYKRALKILEEVYSVRCRVLGEEHPETLTTLNLISGVYANLAEYEKTLETVKKVYSSQCKVLGEEHPVTLITLGNMAMAYGYKKEYKRAHELLNKVYTKRCRILGKEHPDTLITREYLADSYSFSGDSKKAVAILDEIYAVRLKKLGEKHPETITTMHDLGRNYIKLGEYKKASVILKKAYNLRCGTLGENHPDTLETLKFLDMLL